MNSCITQDIECTTDHNCLIESEKLRILNNGGRISKLSTNAGPLRVWQK